MNANKAVFESSCGKVTERVYEPGSLLSLKRDAKEWGESLGAEFVMIHHAGKKFRVVCEKPQDYYFFSSTYADGMTAYDSCCCTLSRAIEMVQPIEPPLSLEIESEIVQIKDCDGLVVYEERFVYDSE